MPPYRRRDPILGTQIIVRITFHFPEKKENITVAGMGEDFGVRSRLKLGIRAQSLPSKSCSNENAITFATITSRGRKPTNAWERLTSGILSPFPKALLITRSACARTCRSIPWLRHRSRIANEDSVLSPPTNTPSCSASTPPRRPNSLLNSVQLPSPTAPRNASAIAIW